MLFRELKNGYTVYLLDKSTMKVGQVKVIDVGAPYNEAPKLGQLAPSQQRMVDVTIERDGRSHIYAIPEHASLTYAGDIVLSCEAEGILREVKAVMEHSRGVLASVPSHEERIKAGEEIIARLDNSYKEKRLLEGRLTNVEDGVRELRDEIRMLINKLE